MQRLQVYRGDRQTPIQGRTIPTAEAFNFLAACPESLHCEANGLEVSPPTKSSSSSCRKKGRNENTGIPAKSYVDKLCLEAVKHMPPALAICFGLDEAALTEISMTDRQSRHIGSKRRRCRNRQSVCKDKVSHRSAQCSHESDHDDDDEHIKRFGGRLLGGAPPGYILNGESLLLLSTIVEGVVDGGLQMPLFYMLKDDFLLSPVDMSLVFGVSFLPWAAKTPLALLADRVKLFGRGRVAYLGLGASLLSGSVIAMPMLQTLPSVVVCMFGSSLGRCLMSASLQGMLAQASRSRDQNSSNKLVGDFFLYKAGGALVGSLLTSLALARSGPTLIFYSVGALPLGLVLGIARQQVSDVPQEYRQDAAPDPEAHGQLMRLMKSPVLLSPLLFLFLYNAGPNYDDALYYYFIARLHFGPGFMGQLQTMHALAKVLGVVWYRYFLHDADEERVMVKVTAISLPLYLTPVLLTTGAYEHLPVPPQALALSGELIRELFLHLQMMPATAQWARLCPPGYEGTVLSLLISAVSLSRVISKGTSAATAAALGVTAHDFSNLTLLVCICGASMLLPLSLSAFNLMPAKAEEAGHGGDLGHTGSVLRFHRAVQLESISEDGEDEPQGQSDDNHDDDNASNASTPAPAG